MFRSLLVEVLLSSRDFAVKRGLRASADLLEALKDPNVQKEMDVACRDLPPALS